MPPLSPTAFSILSGPRYPRPTNARGLAWITPYQPPTCSAAHARAPLRNSVVRGGKLAQAGKIISEIGDLLRCHRLQGFRHGRVIALAAVVLVLAKRLGEIILALVGNARNVLLAGEVGVVAGIAMILLRQRVTPLHPCRIAGIGGRPGLRQLGDKIRKYAQIVVGERL